MEQNISSPSFSTYSLERKNVLCTSQQWNEELEVNIVSSVQDPSFSFQAIADQFNHLWYVFNGQYAAAGPLAIRRPCTSPPAHEPTSYSKTARQFRLSFAGSFEV